MDDVVAVMTDLYFASRIGAAARAARRVIRFVRSEEHVKPISGFRVAFVDLDAGLDAPGIIRLLKGKGGTIIAFGPHLDTDKRKLARSAGADRVLAKSKFVTELPRIMNDITPPPIPGRDDLSDLAQYGRKMQELGALLQDPSSARRIYFAPDIHMETARGGGEPIVLDTADYADFLAVEVLRAKLDRVRGEGIAALGRE